MKFLGILRASALFILLSAFQGQPVSCGILNRILSSKKSSTVEVSEISENLEESTVESQAVENSSQEPSSESSAPLPKSGLVFESFTWDDSHLASAFLFVREFCKDVISKKFDGKVTNKRLCEDVKDVCGGCLGRLKFLSDYFTPTYGPSRVGERKEIPKNFYEDALKPEDFDVYAIWLEKNIQNIIKSYKKMLLESLKMTATELKTDTSVGPLKYGFVYDGYWWNAIAAWWLNIEDDSPLTLLDFLDNLQRYLQKILKSSPKRSIVEAPLVKEAEDSPVKSQAV